MMFYVDTHFHAGEYIADMTSYCREADEASVKKLILCAGNFEESEKAALFAKENSAIYFAAGVHPHEADSMTQTIADFRAFAEKKKFVAVGEIGLDFFYETSARSVQEKVFASFLELALELNVPALIHCRDKADSCDAYATALELLTAFHRKGGRYLLHCYAGNAFYARKFMDAGAVFGVGGMLTFKMAENIRQVIAEIPLERLVLETDAPYLAPVPHRGSENHSKYIPLVAQKLAWLKNTTLEQCAAQTTANALAFFQIREEQPS